MKYFAYGSNMSLLRLRSRVPSAKRLGVFLLQGHELRFHKTGKDGSSKCDAYLTGSPTDSVIGALFEMDEREKVDLDTAEGLGYGYAEKVVEVRNDAGDVIEAVTYFALRIDPTLKPYSWYLHHVVVGAIETKVPGQYLKDIQSTESIEDMDIKRDRKQRAIYG